SMTTMIAKPSMMPQRRQESSPTTTTATTAKPVERTFRRRTGYMSNTTLADQLAAVVDPELLFRPACDQACDRVQMHAEEVPEGRTSPRWQQKTAETVKALLELWFGLDKGKQPNLLPSILKVARKIFVEVCVEFKVLGAPGQKAEWYSSLEEQVKAARKSSKNTRPIPHSPKKTKQETTVTAVASKVKPEGEKNLEERCEEAIGHLQRYGRKHVERKGGRKSQRWSETTLDLAVALLTAYFFGTPHGELEEQLKDSVIKEARNRFAYACLKHGLSGIPGQQAAWYAEVQKSTRRFIDSQLIANAS
ncbi:MAG TPA: hypothetical protein VFT59_01500, partial [Candidatus Saccharimonadales bacterium]|nr:hypothetical protein [Candidatus Saccharimonadales bacterium]